MIVPGSANPLLLAGGAAKPAISGSLRFRGSATAYLNRTPISAGTSSSVFSISFWAKRGAFGITGYLFDAFQDANNRFYVTFLSDDTIQICQIVSGASTLNFKTTAVFRDPSSWYHFLVSINSGASGAQKCRLWVNGVENTVWTTSLNATFTTATWNTTNQHRIAQYGGGGANCFDGYMSDINFIDGLALTANDFGQFNATTGVWEAKSYTGAYGTNGFKLDFSDNTTTTTLCQDKSGNNNHWTPTNISLANDATYDSMIDVPPVYGLTAGVQPRGNYCVLNPIGNGGNGTVSNGNLSYSSPSWMCVSGTMFFSSGKFYFEARVTSSALSAMYGVINDSFPSSAYASYPGASPYGWALQSSPTGTGKWNNNLSSNLSNDVQALGDVYTVAFDVDAGKIWFGKNGVWYGGGDPSTGANAAYINLTGKLSPVVSGNAASDVVAANFGQQPFKYTPPSGFRSLCSTNLPEPSIVNGAAHMAAVTYTGDGTGTKKVSTGFKPDLVWIKDRTTAYDNHLFDSVRGLNSLVSNDANIEGFYDTHLTSYDANGFTLATGDPRYIVYINKLNDQYISWNWKGGSSTIPTGGTITPTGASVNVAGGFSVIGYTGNGVAGATVPHGLGAAPSLIIIKCRSNAISAPAWIVYHSTLGETKSIELSATSAAVVGNWAWNDTAPTPSVFSLGPSSTLNTSGFTYIAYCWTPIAGYSSFGSYTANASTDGPMVFTNFRPKFILLKNTTRILDWIIYDSSRDLYNTETQQLYPNLGIVEDVGAKIDFLSNGFKIREGSGSGINNTSGDVYIYAAFAENPMKYSLAR